MRNKTRKIVSVMTALIMILSCMPLNALAALVPTHQVNTSSGVTLRSVVNTDVYDTYVFYNDNAVVRQQKVVPGDYLYAPGTPTAPDGSNKFVGWAIDGDSSQIISFDADGHYTVNSTSGATVRVEAVFADYVFATFYDQDGVVYSRIGVAKNSTVNSLDYTPKTAFQNMAGWSTEKNADNTGVPANKATFPYTMTADQSFYPIIETGYWIHFDANRSHVSGMDTVNVSYTAPLFVHSGESLAGKKPANPVADITAYTFEDWYTDPECTRRFNWNTATIDSNTTLYANWNIGQAEYKVVIWQQKVTDDKNATGDARSWDYLTSYTGKATIGTTITYNSSLRYNNSNEIVISNSGNKRIDQLTYTGFTCDHYDTSITVAADGSSTLNVWYRRNLMTINFWWTNHNGTVISWETTTSNSPEEQYRLDSATGEYVRVYRHRDYGWQSYKWYYDSNHTREYTGTRYKQVTTTMPWRTITGLYGATFAQSVSDGDNRDDYTWPAQYKWNEQSNGGGTTQTLLTAFTQTDNPYKLYHQGDSGTGFAIYHVRQKADGSWPADVNEAGDVDTAYGNGGSFSISRKYKDFKPIAYSTSGSYSPPESGPSTADMISTTGITGYPIIIYHARELKTIEFWNGNEKIDAYTDDEVMVGQSLASFAGKELETPDDAHWTFGGWSYSPNEHDANNAIDWSGATMPARTLQVYAIWVPIAYNVKLDLGATDVNMPLWTEESQTGQKLDFWPTYGATIDSTYMMAATRPGYTLVGWFDANGHAWDFGNAVTKDLCDEGPLYDEQYKNNYYVLHLTAKWRISATVRASYSFGEYANNVSNAGVFVDNNNYLHQGGFSVINIQPVLTGDISSTIEFVGWRDLKGRLHNPGDTFVIDDVELLERDDNVLDAQGNPVMFLKLTAVYDTGVPKSYITYHANYTGSTDDDVIDNNDGSYYVWNDSVTMPNDTFERFPYEIIGWSTTPGATEADFEADANVLVSAMSTWDNNGDYDHETLIGNNHLYAVWKEAEADFTYQVASDSTGLGEVSLDAETVPVLTGTAQGSTASVKDNNPNVRFVGWSTTDAGEPTITTEKVTPQKNADGIYESTNYYAHYEVKYTVQHLLKGTTTKVADDETVWVKQNTVIDDVSKIPAATSFYNTYAGYTLTKDSMNPTTAVTITSAGATITLYYTLPLTISATTASKPYDGTPLNGAYTVNGALTADEAGITASLGTAPSITNVSESPKQYLTKTEQEAITDIPSYYNVTFTPGALTIEKRSLTLTSGSASKEYDGVALTNEDVEDKNANGLTVETGWVDGEGASYEFSASVLYAGETETNAFSITPNEGTLLSNYDLTKTEGTLSITENTTAITVVPGSGSKTYDGSALTKTEHDDFTVTGVPEGFTWTAVADGTVTNVVPGEGEKAVNAVTEFKIFNADNEDVTNQFSNITKSATGTLTINPKAVTLTSGSKTREYNGSALTNDEVEGRNGNGLTVENGWVDGEGATYEFSGTITKAGEKANAFEYTLKAGTTASNYTITKNEGTLKITENTTAITVVPGSDSKTYDGSALTKTEHDDFTVTGVPEGFTWTATADGTVTNVVPGEGEKAVNAVTEFKIFNAANEDVTDQFSNITKSATGTLTIDPKAVTLTSGSKTREYNGNELTNDEVEGKNANGLTTEDGWVEGEGATYEFSGTITKVGEKANAFEYTLKTGTTATNYAITKTEGTLKITENTTAITVVPGSGSKTYDGSALTKTEHDDFTVTGVPEGFTWTAVADGTVKNVVPGEGEKAVNAVTEFKIFNAANEDVTDQFSNITKSATGTLTIDPKAVTLTSGSKTREYNGNELTNDEVEGTNANGLTTEDGWVEGEGATYEFSGTITKVGEKANAFEYTLKTGTTATNYTITKTEGTLKITENTTAITVVPGSGSKTYDGSALTKTEHDDFTVTGVPEGFTWTAAADGTVKNVVPGEGEKAVNAVTEFKIFNAANEDVTDQFSNITKSATGTLTITPVEIELTADSDKKVYDGTALTKDSYQISTGAFVGEEGLESVTIVGSQTLVGSSDNEITGHVLKTNTNGNNYIISYAKGTLTVTDGTAPGEEPVPDDLVVTKDDNSDNAYRMGDVIEWTITVTNIYNETKSLTVTEAQGMEIEGDVPATLGAGDTVEIKVRHTVTAEDVVAGNIRNEVTVKIGDLEKKGEDTVSTEPIEIEITAASDSKVYDGEALTNDGYEVTTGKLNENDEISEITVEGSQTLVGESANVASDAIITDADGKDVTAGYAITYIDGTLTVTDGTAPGEEPVPDELVVTKDDNSEKSYKVGETVEWTITVTNIYDETKALTVTEAEGMNIIGEVPETLEAGETVEIRVQHVVTAEDAANGPVRNEVTVKIGDLEKKGEDTVETVPQYRLTVNYWIGTTPAAESFTNVYDSGDTYAVTSPTILGYTADQARVTGTITADTTLNVYYTVNSYNLTVNYVYMDGSQAAQTYTAAVAYGTAYSVTSPAVEGFTPNTAVVEGTMPARDVIHTVIYTAVPAPAQPDAPADAPAAAPAPVPAPAVEHIPLVILEDYDTPLGIPNLNLCIGDMYE